MNLLVLSQTLFVGSLPENQTNLESELHAAFSPFGEIESIKVSILPSKDECHLWELSTAHQVQTESEVGMSKAAERQAVHREACSLASS